MIRHEISVEEMFKELLSPECLPDSVEDNLPLAERLKAQESLRTIAQDTDNIRTICTGCGEATPLLKSAACVCGGFVCEACQRTEEDGVCNHDDPLDALNG